MTETRVQVTFQIRVSDLTLYPGDVYYYTYHPDIIHRDNDLPALIRANGDQEWLQHGLLHRDNDLPALIKADGRKEYYQHDELHREGDLPAIIWTNGDQMWFQHDQYHRERNLPARIWVDGTKGYWVYNQQHSLLTPANRNGWYLNGLQYFKD